MGIQVWDREKILVEAKVMIEKYGDLPGATKLKKYNRLDFWNAVRRYYPGKMTQLRIDLDKPLSQRPFGYWTKKQLISETKRIIKAEGKFPSQKRLTELGFTTISIYAQKYFGGLRELAIECGIDEKELWTKFGYWKDINHVIQEIGPVIEDLGRFPTTTDLRVNKNRKFLSAISTYHGGLRNVRKIMGYIKKSPIAKDGHYCDSFSEVIVDDFLFINKISHKRNIQFDFHEIKCRPDFVLDNMLLIEVLMADYRIKGHQGRYKQYVERYLRKKIAYNKNGLEVIEVFQDELNDKNKFDEKFNYIAEKANAVRPFILKDYTNIIFFDKKSPGYWLNPDNLKKEIFPLINKYGKLPSIKELRQIGRNDIEGAIVNNYRSYRNVAKAIGIEYDNLIKPQRYWQNIDNIKEELEPIIKKYGFIPSRAELMRIGKRGIVAAIDTYKGSLKSIAKSLGVEYLPAKKTNGHWLTNENIKNELQKITTQLGKFPTAADLRKYKLHGLLKGILINYGNFRNAAKEFGLDIPQNKPKGYWKILSNVINELEPFYRKYGKIPSCKFLVKQKPILMYAIRNYHGGMQNVRNAFEENRST